MIVLLSRVVLVASNTCARQAEAKGEASQWGETRSDLRASCCLFTYSHLSLFLGEVGGDVFEGGRCTGPEGEVTLSELTSLQDQTTPASSQPAGRVLVLLADPHGLLVIRFKELKVLVDLDSLPAVLAHVKRCLDTSKPR